MKRGCLALVFLFALGALVFGQTGAQEEINYLLFSPNSSDEFVNQDQARTQLDDLAKYLAGRNLGARQISVYGYAADVDNDIEPVNLSRDRARFVISELQRRGLSPNLFSDPVGHGSVSLWGNNEEEAGRIPNRRVRILVDGTIVTPVIVAAEPEPPPPVMVIEEEPIQEEEAAEVVEVIEVVDAVDKSDSKFPWLLLLLPLLALLILLLARRKKSPKEPKPVPVVEPKPAPVVESKPVPPAEPKPVPPAKPVEKPAVVPAAAKYTQVSINLDDEIRFHAYELYLLRGGQDGDDYGDWCRSVGEVCARYKPNGYHFHTENGSWWAIKFSSQPVS